MKTRDSGMPAESLWGTFFNPGEALSKLGLTADCVDVVDFGCGYGTFTVPAAMQVRGVVYAIDIDPQMVAATQLKADTAGLGNVVVRQRDFVSEGTGLPDESVDFAMLFNILHARERMALLNEARRVLKAGARLAVMHWNYDPNTPRGPSMDIRPRPEELRSSAEQAGFECLPPGMVDLKPYHYGFVFRREG